MKFSKKIIKRRFIEELSAEEQYEYVSEWLSLDRMPILFPAFKQEELEGHFFGYISQARDKYIWVVPIECKEGNLREILFTDLSPKFIMRMSYFSGAEKGRIIKGKYNEVKTKLGKEKDSLWNIVCPHCEAGL